MLAPSEDSFQKIMAALNKQCAYRAEAAKHGQWMPNWKNAVNWLTKNSYIECGPGAVSNVKSALQHSKKQKYTDMN